jgi:hypothetical protein
VLAAMLAALAGSGEPSARPNAGPAPAGHRAMVATLCSHLAEDGGNVAIALVMASLLLTLVLWSGAIVVGALLLF